MKNDSRKIIFILCISLLLTIPACKNQTPPGSGLKPFQDGELWGFIDSKKETVISPQYYDVLPFSEGLAAVKGSQFWGFINTNGVEIVNPTAYIRVGSFSNGKARVNLNGRWGFIDQNGVEVIRPDSYEFVGDFSDGLAIAYSNKSYGYIDEDGQIAIEFIYDMVWDFANNKAKVLLGNKLGFIDKKGSEVIPIAYDLISNFIDGKALARVENTWILIDENGNESAALNYDYIWDADNQGFYKVFKNDKYGFINKQGKEVIPLKYDYTEDFNNDLAIVSTQNNFGMIDRKGNEIIPIAYKNIGIKNRNQIILESDTQKNAIVDRFGNGGATITYDQINLTSVEEITETGEFTDPRDAQEYTWTKIGQQIWMNENLQFYTPDSRCDQDNCKKYGRYYNWEVAKNVCPEGWKLPSTSEWDQLIKHYGTEELAYHALKPGGISTLNFNLGGYMYNASSFENIDEYGYYWTSTSSADMKASCIWFNSYESSVLQFSEGQNHLRNVRCIKK
ncbi:MAG: WG repeat-containing protein [Prolixibacteraceae bacterium]